MKEHTITVYSTPTCPYCVMAKDYFSKKGVSYHDIDVTKDRVAAQQMVEKSGQMGVPVITIDDNVIVGFRPDVFEELLAA